MTELEKQLRWIGFWWAVGFTVKATLAIGFLYVASHFIVKHW